MKRLLLSVVLLGAAASPLDAQTFQRAQNNYVVGPTISCIGIDGFNAERCLLPAQTLADQTGAAFGTAANPIITGGNSTARGGANMATGQVAVGTTSTLVVAARASRQRVTITSTSAVVFYVGNNGVTAATGGYVAGTAGASITLDTSAAVYAVGASSLTVSYIELY